MNDKTLPRMLLPSLIAVSLLFPSCAALRPSGGAAPGPVLRSALITSEDIKEAARIEGDLATRSSTLPGRDSSWIKVLAGDVTVVVTAPHSTRSIREGKLREFADSGSGSMAVMLHRLAGVTAIYSDMASPSDPNYYDDNEFKRALRDVLETGKVKLVLDLHTSDPVRPYDVDFGTMNGASLLTDESALAELVHAFQAEGFTAFSRDYFSGSKNQTVIKFASRMKVPAIQIELSGAVMSPGASDKGREPLDAVMGHRYAQVLQALLRFVCQRGAAGERCPTVGVAEGLE